jgi:uncharacterized membrane protein YczE
VLRVVLEAEVENRAVRALRDATILEPSSIGIDLQLFAKAGNTAKHALEEELVAQRELEVAWRRLFHLDLELIARLLKDGLHIATLLAAVATAWSLDIAPLLIRAGLKNYGQKPHQVAKDVARMNG